MTTAAAPVPVSGSPRGVGIDLCGVSKRFGEAIMELEFVTAEELFPMMARQLEEVFYTVLQVSSGSFYFFDRFDDKAVLHRHNLNASALLMEGVRRMDEMRFFRERVPSEDYIPTPTGLPKKPPDVLLEVFGQCDGRRSVAEIGRRIGQLEFEVTRAVFQLLSGGFLTVASPRPQGAEAIVAEDETSTLIGPGWTAVVNGLGYLEIIRA